MCSSDIQDRDWRLCREWSGRWWRRCGSWIVGRDPYDLWRNSSYIHECTYWGEYLPHYEDCGYIYVTPSAYTYRFREYPQFSGLGHCKETGCTLRSTVPLHISVANGSRLISSSMCHNLPWMINNVAFQTNVMVVSLGSCEMIIGVQWLSTLGPLFVGFWEAGNAD